MSEHQFDNESGKKPYTLPLHWQVVDYTGQLVEESFRRGVKTNEPSCNAIPLAAIFSAFILLWVAAYYIGNAMYGDIGVAFVREANRADRIEARCLEVIQCECMGPLD